MREFSLLTLLLLMTVFVSAQAVTVKFTAEDQNGNYCPFDAVKVTNISQNWDQTLAYPDTILVLNYTDGVAESSVIEGLTQNNPNPFKGTTEATLTLTEAEQAIVQVFDIKGKVLLEFRGNLAQGEHVIKVTLAEPQMVLLRVHTSRNDHVVKMLNVGRGGSNHIEINDLSQNTTNMTKAEGLGPFTLGDVLSYTGVKMQDAVMVLSNNTITQAQYGDEVVTFVFDVETPVEPQLPIVVTRDVIDVTFTTAVCGGEVISDGGIEVTARGVCWATIDNPTTNDNHTTDGCGLGEFVSNLSDLTAGTTYYVRTYATNSIGTAYGEQFSFTTEDKPLAPIGGLAGKFSVSESLQVYFSQGNLQYNVAQGVHATLDNGTAQGTWRFAEHQWDYIGDANSNISENYSGIPDLAWIDLFGWGTSGWNSGSVCYQPWSTNTNSYNYWPGDYYEISLTGDYENADWGVYNAIINGGNAPGLWRTLTNEEWVYIMYNRATESAMLFAKANVNGVNGIILFPDDWNASLYMINNVNDNDAGYSVNIIEENIWVNTFEVNGAVFLPAAGQRSNYYTGDPATWVGGCGQMGYYWSSSYHSISTAWDLLFANGYLRMDAGERYYGFSVRLVQNFYNQNLPIVTTNSITNITSTSATCGGEVISDGGMEVTARGVCWSANHVPTLNDNYTVDGSGIGSFISSITEISTIGPVFVRAYATNSEGTAYGQIEAICPQGALPEVYSVSSTKVVLFSQGNLQYQASTNTWRFAESQLDYIGGNNSNISLSYDGWIDLFGWGTGDNPTNTSTSYGSYGLFIDWGCNPINNGGNNANNWCTLAKDEWEYLVFSRITVSGIRYAKAMVNDVAGLIILPDNWNNSYYELNNTNNGEAEYAVNVIALADWMNCFETHGAVFLPAAGRRYGTTVDIEAGIMGQYWSSTPNGAGFAWSLYFGSYLSVGTGHRFNGYPVRLVSNNDR